MERPMRGRSWADPAAPADRPDAIVSVAPAATRDPRLEPRAKRPLATFVAQLIAVDQHLPQARLHRRAEPEEAIAAYTAPAERPATGRRLRQSL